MGSKATLEIEQSATVGGERPRREQVRHAIERRLLYDRIERLERELEREQRRREQIVDQYERLLEAREAATVRKTGAESGLLNRLF